ncbi:tannase and feruloyl esterase-domain-containing protein [Xylogone sp. PMI_703]|nr:tannase and feruloyl esterase-domain-containing protein [Xylogone sp. PMI_703]
MGMFIMEPSLAEGFAVATTDGGHSDSPSSAPQYTIDWALSSPGNVNWPLLVDFSYIALHDMAMIAKSITESFYGVSPQYSYFHGASTGGRQALMLAQRHPEDFNGIICIEFAINWTKFLFSSIWPQFIMDRLGHFPRPCEINAITAAAIAACDELEGVKDGIISLPGLCDFDPHSIIGETFECEGEPLQFSAAAADIIESALVGPRSRTGAFQWYGVTQGFALAGPGYGAAMTDCDEARNCKSSPFPISIVRATHWVMKDPLATRENISHAEWDVIFHSFVNEYNSIIGTVDPGSLRVPSSWRKATFVAWNERPVNPCQWLCRLL